ncbi:MAG: ROK family protein [Nanoarchaeota archaeon]|nr:ROK family protein [Nanoarchaeota archaeon]
MAGSKVISLDIGGTNTRAALVKNGRVLKYFKSPTPKTKENFLKNVAEMINLVLDKDVKTIGVGCPGPLTKGVILNPPNLPLKNFNLEKFIKNKFGKKVVIENDAKCVALAELKLGCKRNNFVILTLGTGIGGGIIIDNKLYAGSHGYSGEISGIILDKGKSFEDLWKEKKLQIQELFEKKDFKELEKISRYLGQGIASLINVFDPEVVILMGGVREVGKPFLDMIKRHAKNYVLLPSIPDIKWSKLDHPGLLGASLLVK